MTNVPDPFRPSQRRHRVIEDANEEQLGKALPDMVIRQLDQHLDLLGPAGRHGSMSRRGSAGNAPDHLPDPA